MWVRFKQMQFPVNNFFLFIYLFKENGISVLSKQSVGQTEAAAVHPRLGKYDFFFFPNVILLSHELRFPFGSKH